VIIITFASMGLWPFNVQKSKTEMMGSGASLCKYVLKMDTYDCATRWSDHTCLRWFRQKRPRGARHNNKSGALATAVAQRDLSPDFR
jgi:hypothetical protein